MKARIILLTTVIPFLMFFTACEECCQEKEMSEDKKDFLKTVHAQIPITCSDPSANQLFQIDLDNNLIITGQVLDCEFDGTNYVIKKAKFTITEDGNCKRFKVTHVDWVPLAEPLRNTYTHAMTIKLNYLKQPSDNPDFILVSKGVSFLPDNNLTISLLASDDPSTGYPPPPIVIVPQLTEDDDVICPVVVK